MTLKKLLFVTALAAIFACSQKTNNTNIPATNEMGQPVYHDKPFIQPFSVKYYLSPDQPENNFWQFLLTVTTTFTFFLKKECWCPITEVFFIRAN